MSVQEPVCGSLIRISARDLPRRAFSENTGTTILLLMIPHPALGLVERPASALSSASLTLVRGSRV